MGMTGEKFVDVDGIRTRYFEKGSGEIVVLFHGGYFGSTASANSADDWDLNFDGLARWFRVFAVDRLGQGYTGNPANDDYTMDAVVRHAAAALHALGIAGAHMVGHSGGGYLACRLTVERPELAKTCTIVDGGACAPGVGRDEFMFANMPAPALSAESQRWVLEKQSCDPGCVTEEWIDALVAVAERPDYREAVRKMTVDGYQWTRFLPGLQTRKEEMFRILGTRGIQRPVMQIWGDRDPVVSLDQAMQLFRILAGKERRARWHILSRAGHFGFRERPERFNEVLKSFIRSP